MTIARWWRNNPHRLLNVFSGACGPDQAARALPFAACNLQKRHLSYIRPSLPCGQGFDKLVSHAEPMNFF